MAVAAIPAWAIYASMAATAAVTAASAISAGNAQKSAASYNAQVDQQNAQQQQGVAASQELAQDRSDRQKLGQEASAFGAGGVDMSGTPLDVMADSATQARLNALSIKYNGQVGANRDLSQGAIATFQGNQAQTAGYLNAGSTLLTAGTKFATGYTSPSSTAGFGATNQIGANGVALQTNNGFAVGSI
ncbi:MAG TPA: hypothetical protein VGV37_02485 [Aliidongia sp.]|uniref:hypothetical protein n=1 Tax=Aliidongia sp. TaxID=1914230 RepID=UPI002DDD2542|nr:hypothetical protein [Aliidongia sp.]HEV2673378.1 hypothetical protein [Aliidongia sp.]